MLYKNYTSFENQKATNNTFNPSFLSKSDKSNKAIDTALNASTKLKILDSDFPLGINAKSSSPPPKLDIPLGTKRSESQTIRAERYFLQHYARNILTSAGIRNGLEYPANYHQTAKCSHVRHGDGVGVHNSVEHGKAFFSGLIMCGRVFTCPVCASKIQEKRRLEIAKAFDYAYQTLNKKIIMVTFTFSHYRFDKLKELLEKQSEAYRFLRSGKAWQKLKNSIGFSGLIRSLEVTHGQNGWHPHTHEAWIVNKNCDVNDLLLKLKIRWFNVCSKFGLVNDLKTEQFLEHAVHITDNCHTSEYLAKQDDSRHWGSDRELAKGASKVNQKGKGHHPFQFLSDYANNIDAKKSFAKFLEYADSMRNKSQIFWSRGLKDAVGLKDKTDEELVEEKEDKAVLLGSLLNSDWDIIKTLNCKALILDIAEKHGFSGIEKFFNYYFEFEPTKKEMKLKIPFLFPT